MSTFLLTWNPARLPFANLAEVSQQTAEGTPFASRWTTGKTKNITRGDRVFLLKQGKPPRGIIAAGWVTSEEVYEAPHYDAQRKAQGDTALRADVEFERILNPAQVAPLTIETIDSGPLTKVHWKPRASGMKLPEDVAGDLEDLWAKHLEGIDNSRYLEASEAEDKEAASGARKAFTLRDGDWRASIFCQIKARRGQQAFRDALRQRYGNECMITRCGLMDVVEAAHIKAYRGDADNHPANGLLLRADIHTLYDLDLIGIEPDTLIVRVHEKAKQAGYEPFDGVMLQCGAAKPSEVALAIRWESFRGRQTA